MTKIIGVETQALLSDARRNGLVIRDFVWINAKDRVTGLREAIGLWTGRVPISASVIDPETGEAIMRDFVGIGGLLAVPPIPGNTELEVRTVRLRFSRLSTAMINAIRLYDPNLAPVQIHRGIFDPQTNRLLEPAMVRFDGYINKAPIRVPKSNGEGGIELECVSRSRILTRTSGALFSKQTLKQRDDDKFGDYLDRVGAWRMWWGEEEEKRKERKHKKERWYKGR